MEVQTKRLHLRPWRETDAETLYEYARDPAVGPIAGWKPHASPADSLEIIRTVLSAPETYAVCLDGKPVGSIGLMKPNQTRFPVDGMELEIGYWIGVPFWGCGYIPEAVEALLHHAFEDLGCTAVLRPLRRQRPFPQSAGEMRLRLPSHRDRQAQRHHGRRPHGAFFAPVERTVDKPVR